jgi:hypothetical protein
MTSRSKLVAVGLVIAMALLPSAALIACRQGMPAMVAEDSHSAMMFMAMPNNGTVILASAQCCQISVAGTILATSIRTPETKRAVLAAGPAIPAISLIANRQQLSTSEAAPGSPPQSLLCVFRV